MFDQLVAIAASMISLDRSVHYLIRDVEVFDL
jgi:hypothetical protein